MNDFKIREVRTEYQVNPIGLDVEKPRFSWKLSSAERGCKQSAWQVLVGTVQNTGDCWDSGRVESDCSIGVSYEGAALAPCTRYFLTVTVWNEKGEPATAESWFETGLMNPSQTAWDGAQWIGAPERYVSTKTMGVFVISANITLEEGSSRAGIVFGANDARLMDARKNQYEIAGENFIRYVLDVTQIPAVLEIYRVGYHPEDTAEKPFATVPVVSLQYGNRTGFLPKDAVPQEESPVITEENRYGEHELTVEVIGDGAYAYVDGVLVDAKVDQAFFGPVVNARQLNPLAANDTTTFPRLCEIGYYVGAGDTAEFGDLVVKNYREPRGEVVRARAKELLAGCCGVEAVKEQPAGCCGGKDGTAKLAGVDASGNPRQMQRVADVSARSIPMLRRDFSVDGAKELSGARLYITARGIYDCRINGKEITDTWFNPGASQFDKHIMYQTYDVTDLLRSGENGIGITLASGWWCDAQTFVLRNYNYYGDQESVLAKLVVQYADGSCERIVTNPADWDYYGEGPYTYAGFFQGEHLDGRQLSVYEDFSLPGYQISGMKKPAEIQPVVIPEVATMPPGFGRAWPKVDHSQTKIVGGVNAPVVVGCGLKAKYITQQRKGIYL